MEEKNYQVKRNLSAIEKTTSLLNDLPDYMTRFVSHMSTMKNSSRLTVYEYVRDISIIFRLSQKSILLYTIKRYNRGCSGSSEY